MIKENSNYKIVRSQKFNMFYNKATGTTITFGETVDEDPDYCPQGPVLADIELSTICHQGCRFCYKSNTPDGVNMTLDTFKRIFHILPRTLTQIAFGIGDITANPDLPDILRYCKDNQYQYITPNVTINGGMMNEDLYHLLVQNCGAVAVSYYDEDTCFNAVDRLTTLGLNQVNIHALLSEETVDQCSMLIDKVTSDPRLKKLNAVVFLMLKNKGRGTSLHRVTDEKYAEFTRKLMASGINFGFDSCGAGRLLNFGIDKSLEPFIEPCESGLFSIYVNAEGRFFPCSFTEGIKGWEEGINLLEVTDFMDQVWFHPRVIKWRDNLLGNKRRCPEYNI